MGRIIVVLIAGFIVYSCGFGLASGFKMGSQPPVRKDVHILSENKFSMFSDNHVLSENHALSDNTNGDPSPLLWIGAGLLVVVLLSGKKGQP